jgi:hypothetical protein
MDDFWKSAIWQQLGGAIQMLENAIQACPDELWKNDSKPPEWVQGGVVGFWYLAFHTLFFLDLYMSKQPDGFAPPEPFTLDELHPDGHLPERAYSKEELLQYLEHARTKCKQVIESMTEAEARGRCGIPWVELSGAELLLSNIRHVQHHAAQLNLLMRQGTDSAPKWVWRAKAE